MLSLCFVISTQANQISLYEENDCLEKNNGDVTDGYYTQGFSVRYEDDANWGLKLSQQIYTPENKDDPNPQYNDRPYAGWLHGEWFKKTFNENYENYYEIGLGIVGPASGGEWVQTEVHKLIKSSPPMGWKWQLNNEPTMQLAYYRTYSIFACEYIEFRPYAGVNLGNALTDAEMGNIIRLGYNIPKNFDPVIRSVKKDGSFMNNTYAYTFVGGKVYGVARNIFLDGNTFSDNEVTVDKENIVGDALLGLCLGVYNVEVTITHVERTKEFETQTRNNRFDSIQLCYKF